MKSLICSFAAINFKELVFFESSLVKAIKQKKKKKRLDKI